LRRRDSSIGALTLPEGLDHNSHQHYALSAVQRSCEDPPVVANIKSQIKRNKQNERRHARNKAVRSELKTRVKSAVTAAERGDENATDAARQATKRIDKAAAKGVIHKNAAARRKSRLMKRLAKVSAPAG
jgi:small subunit ribosomal protein S20